MIPHRRQRQNGMAGNGAGKAADGRTSAPRGPLPPRLALCAALAAAAASAQTAPVYKIDRVAGSGEYVSGDRIGENDGGPAIDAHMSPEDVELDAAGNLFIADYYRVRRVDAATGVIATVAGNGKDGYSGDGGPAVEAQFAPGGAVSVALDAAGNLFILDAYTRVRRVDAATGVIATVAGNGERGYGGDGGPAVEAEFNASDIALDAAGNLFIADAGNRRIRRVDAAAGVITTIAGGVQDPADCAAALDSIQAIALDGAGNVFVAGNYDICKIDAATGVISNIEEGIRHGAVGGSLGANTRGMALDAAGNVFVANWLRILRVDAAAGVVSHVAGNGEYNLQAVYSGDGGLALNAGVHARGMAVDAAGNVFFVGHNTIRRLTPWTGSDPAIFTGGVVQAGGTPVVTRISPNALISVFGRDFTDLGEPALGGALDASGRVPVNLADTCLEFGAEIISNNGGRRTIEGKPVPLFLVSPTQINAQAPHDLAVGEAAMLKVVRGCGTADELAGFAQTRIEASAASPAFFNLVNNPNGRNPLVAQHGGGPALVGPPELGAAFTPAAPGEVVTLYGTGFGPTDPPLEAGEIPGATAALVYPISFRVGGKAVPPQDVLYAGAAPCCAGLYQFTLRLPADLSDGDAPVTAGVLGVFTPQGPFLAIRGR